MKKIIAIALLGLIALSGVVLTSSAEVYGDKTCEQGWLIPGVLPLYICRNPDGGMDHSFLTYTAMNDYYTPQLVETFIPETTYVYGAATETLSGV